MSTYELDDTWVHIAAPMAYALVCGIWAGLVRARSGVQPRLRGMPKPLLGEVARACVGGLLLIATAVAVGQLVSFVLAGEGGAPVAAQ